MKITWIAVDWGTTHVRAWAISGADTVVATNRSDDGMGTLDRDGFDPALERLLAPFEAPEAPVIACGMVGSRQGWVEAPYETVPCAPLSTELAPAPSATRSVRVIPGLKQDKPADVMRGEETQIAGFLALNPGWDGVICLPGTHTKWAHISAGEVVSFQTCMTGDLFAAIAGHTVLRHSVAADAMCDVAFDDGLSMALSKPEALAAQLFALRAEGLLQDLKNPQARGRLSGLLIGAELAATKPYWLGQQIAVVGEGGLAGLYTRAIAQQAGAATQAQAERTTLAGLTAAWRLSKETTA